MSSGKVLLGVLAGVAAGALFGVLFAPDKGSVTRKKISQKSDDYADALKDKFNEFVESVTGKFDKVKDEISGFPENGHSKPGEADKNAKTATV